MARDDRLLVLMTAMQWHAAVTLAVGDPIARFADTELAKEVTVALESFMQPEDVSLPLASFVRVNQMKQHFEIWVRLVSYRVVSLRMTRAEVCSGRR